MNKKLTILTILILSVSNIYSAKPPKPVKAIKIVNKYYQYDEYNKLKDKCEANLEVRLLDTKKTTTALYYIRDFNNENNTIGVKFTIKIGKSYLERKIEELEKKLENDK